MTDQTTTPPDDVLADLIARCPEHGTATETWPECRCAAARKAAAMLAPTNPGTDPCSEPPCQDTETCVRHEMAAEATEAKQCTTDPVPDQDARPAAENTARSTARRQLVSLGLAEWQAVALLLPVIAETYREVAEDAVDGAHGDTWGTTPEEALTAFAAAYRKVAADCDLPGAPLPEATRAMERERAAHEEHRRQLADALKWPLAEFDQTWSQLISRVKRAVEEGALSSKLREDFRVKLNDTKQLAENLQGRATAMEKRATAAEEGERRAHEQRQEMAAERYAWQERGDKAEAALARVRRAFDRLRAAHVNADGEPLSAQDRGVVKALDRILAALDGDQPAEAEHTCPDGEPCPPHDQAAEAPCSHPVAQVDHGRRQCTSCGEWLDPVVREQSAEPDLGAIRAAVAEAVMCGDGPCLTTCHLPKIERLLGSVDLLRA